VRVKVTCRARTTCAGTLRLRRGTTVVARKPVRVRARSTRTFTLRLARTATIAKRQPLRAVAPRRTRVTFLKGQSL
jgi:hypothetical protein